MLSENGTLNKNLYYTNILKSTQNKLLSEYIAELKKEIIRIKKDYDIDLIKETNRLISILSNKYKDIPKEDITEIFYTQWIFETYCGLAFEYYIIDILRNNGFTIHSNKVLDNEYKIDFLVSHKRSNKAIAIQSKSYTYLNCGDTEKEKHINGLKAFKNEGYKYMVFDNPINNVYIKYILHNGLNICSYKNQILIDTDNIKNIFMLDNKANSIDSLIIEINKLLGI